MSYPPREPLPDLQNCTTYYNTQGSSSSSTLSLLSIGSPLLTAHCSLLCSLLTAHCPLVLTTGTHHCSLLTPLGSVRLPLLAFGLSCESGTTSCLNREHNSTRIAARRLSQQAGSNSNSAFTIIFTHTRTHARAHTHTHSSSSSSSSSCCCLP